MVKPDDFETKINGHVWSVHFVRRGQLPKSCFGDCHLERRRIRVRYDVCEQTMLDTLLHELTHALRPHEDEEFVEHTSTQLAKALLVSGIVRIGT